MVKRGSTRPVWLLFMAIMGLFVGALFIKSVANVLDDTSYWRVFYARDIGLMLDSGLTGRGTFDLNYNFLNAPKPFGLNVFSSSNPRVEVYDYDPEISEPLKASYRFAVDENVEMKDEEMLATFFKVFMSLEEAIFTLEPLSTTSCATINTTSNPEDVSVLVRSNQEFIQSYISRGLERSGFSLVTSAENAHLALIVLDENSDSLKFQYKKQPRRTDKLRCLITNELIETIPSAFSVTQFDELDEESEFIEDMLASEQGLIIIIKDLEISTANENLYDSILNGVISYYG